MAKQRSMNELRQEKTYGYKAPVTPKQAAKARAKGYTEIDIDTTKKLIISDLKDEMFDIMFQAVNDEMAKHEVFKTETYFTDQGFEEFQDTWFEFYHDHHGDILSAIMKSFTK